MLPVVLILDFRQIWQDAMTLERKEMLQCLLKRVDVDGKQIVKMYPQEDFRQVLQTCVSSYPITIGF